MADNFEVELAEEVIHHIQSYLDPKDVVRTSVLSNLWYNAWFTNPVLRLYESDFSDTRQIRHDEFYDFATRTINRYLISNTKIYSFSLKLYNPISSTRLVDVDKWILSVLTQGVNDLQLKLLHYNCRDSGAYTLPDQVFSSIHLKKLCLDATGRYIDLHLPQSSGKSKVLCSQLVSLELSWVRLSDDMMKDILLGCPLMEDLRIISCYDLKKINLSVIRCNLRTFHARTWSGLFVDWDENCAPESTVSVQHQYHSLISLKLIGVKVDDLFFEFFPYRFPFLQRLELERCLGPVMINIDIISNSLRYLTLQWMNELSVIKVQVPNIQNFRFESYLDRAEAIPSLSFLTASEEWKSDLRFHQRPGMDRDVQVSWLLKIRDILNELSLSKVSIEVFLSSDAHHTGSISDEIIQNNHISPFVENLKISMPPSKLPISFGLLLKLLCCRPKYLTCLGFSNQYSYEMLELAYNELKKHEIKNLTDALPCIHGLEEVDMEHYDNTLREWRSVRQGTEEAAHGGGEFRLRLKWTRKRLRSMIL